MGLAQKAVRGALGFGTLNIIRYGLTFGTQIALANLLTPEIFGAVALAATLLTFMSLPMRWAVGEALMQETDHENLFSTIFWLRVAVLIPLAAIGTIFYQFLPIFYEKEVATAFLLLALPKAFAMISSQFAAALQREFKLVTLGAIKLASVVIAVPVSIWVVLNGDGVLALVLFYAIQDTVRILATILLSPEYPELSFNEGAARWFFGFARGMWLSKTLDSVESRGDDYLIGSLGGTAALGTYSISWRLAVAFKTIVQPAVNQAILPTFAKLQDADEKSRQGLQFLIRMQLYLAIPGYIIASITAPEFINFTFGNQWADASPILRTLSLTGVLAPIMASARQFYYSRGDSTTIIKIQVYYLSALVIGSILLVPHFGAIGGAVAVDLMSAVAVILFFRRLHLDIGLSVIQSIGTPTVAGLVTALTGFGLRSIHVFNVNSPLLLIAAYSITLFSLYFIVLLIGDRHTLSDDLVIVREALLS